MAIQYAGTTYYSRGKGHDACFRGAYNGCMKIKNYRTNRTHNFTNRKVNLYHQILLPKHVDSKFNNSEALMNEIEFTEKMKNSQLLKEYVLALPDEKEISLEDRIELVHRFIKFERIIEENLGVQIDIHQPEDGETNWYARLLVTTRRFTSDGKTFGEKARDANPQVRSGSRKFVVKAEGINSGENWKKIQNEYFIERALNIRVAELSTPAQVHIGSVRKHSILAEAKKNGLLD